MVVLDNAGLRIDDPLASDDERYREMSERWLSGFLGVANWQDSREARRIGEYAPPDGFTWQFDRDGDGHYWGDNPHLIVAILRWIETVDPQVLGVGEERRVKPFRNFGELFDEFLGVLKSSAMVVRVLRGLQESDGSRERLLWASKSWFMVSGNRKHA